MTQYEETPEREEIRRLMQRVAAGQEAARRRDKVAEIMALGAAVVALPPSTETTISTRQAERNQARAAAQRRLVTLIEELTSTPTPPS